MTVSHSLKLQIEIEPFVKTDDPRIFIEALRVINPHWQWADSLSRRWDIPWIFRGHSSADWSLLPSAWRFSDPNDFSLTEIKTKADEMLARFIKRGGREAVRKALEKSFFDDYVSALVTENAIGPDLTEKQGKRNLEGLLLQIGAQQEFYREFVVLANKVGHSVLSQFGLYGAIEGTHTGAEQVDWFSGHQNLEAHFKRMLVSMPLIQHHGIPTHLLDFTENPLIAAFFAAENVNPKKMSSDDYIAVWAVRRTVIRDVDTNILEKSNCTLCEFTLPRSEISYLHAQQGLHCYDENGVRNYIQHGRWYSFEELLRDTENELGKPLMRLLCLKASKAGKLLELLRLEGISRAHLMPTYDNVSAALYKQWEWED